MDTIIPFITGMLITASATSMTGGVQAGAGQTVTTGDAYSSVRVENVINAGTSGGTSKTTVYTNTNGVELTETQEETIPPSGSVHASFATSTSTKAGGSMSGARVEIHADGEKGTAASSSVVMKSGAASSTLAETRGIGAKITERVSRFFRSIFGWWSFSR